MENKKTLRKVLREIQRLNAQADQGIYMDNLMDGSGECGGIIASGWCNWLNRQVDKVLTKSGLTLEMISEVLDSWAKHEMEMGPKRIFISMYSRRQGMYKEVDYFDTTWGSLAFSIHSSLQYAE
jgi:hypothetical protein